MLHLPQAVLDRPLTASAGGLVFLILFGWIGGELGVPSLFWTEAWWERLRAGAVVGSFLTFLAVTSYYVRGVPECMISAGRIDRFLGVKSTESNLENLYRYLRVLMPTLLGLAILPAILPELFGNVALREILPGNAGPVLWWDWCFAMLLGMTTWITGLLGGCVAACLLAWVSRPIYSYLADYRLEGPRASLLERDEKVREGCSVPNCHGVESCTFRRSSQTSQAPTGCADANWWRVLRRKTAIDSFHGIVTAFYVILVILETLIPAFVTGVLGPAFAICFLMTAVVSVASIVSRWFPNVRIWALIGSILLLAYLNQRADKLRCPHLDGGRAGSADVAGLVAGYVTGNPRPFPRANEAGSARLVDDSAVLRRWCEKNGLAGETRKPKLAIVCVSGGATRSAVWSALALDRIGRVLKERLGVDFGRHVRLITGASGGMVGASYFVLEREAARQQPAGQDRDEAAGLPRRSAWVDQVPRKSLDRVAVHIALLEPVVMLRPFPAGWPPDRGEVLDQTFVGLDVPLQDLVTGEEAGDVPSLVFSPMLVEDGRRLLISNLDLSPLCVTRADELGDNGVLRRGAPSSVTAVEFFRLFPNAIEFRLATAARMSASFPYVSPAVAVPSEPTRRVVDAGYYDNYGVQLATSWLSTHRAFLVENTSGVVLIQLRDTLSVVERLGVTRQPATSWFHPLDGLQFFTSPIEAVSSARNAAGAFRNDEDVSSLQQQFAAASGEPVFFTTVVFEGPVGVPMSWRLSEAEMRTLAEALPLPDELLDSELDELRGPGARDDAPPPPDGESLLKFERLRNYRCLEKLVQWWARAPAGPGLGGGNPAGAGPGNTVPPAGQ